jgi:23S rRNA (guanosine2251-2'-O)-methyltransferase
MENKENSELIIYGKQPVYEALRSEHPVSRIYIAKEMDKRDAFRLSSLAEKRKVKITYTKKSDLQRITGPVLHQGVAATLDEYLYLTEKKFFDLVTSENNPFILILDQIQDPHNLGAILRTAESAGVTALILPEKGSASVTPTVAKTSAGAVFHCFIHRTPDLQDVMLNLKDKNLILVAMVQNLQETIYTSDLSGPMAIVVGSEGKGVRKNIQRLCDKTVSIPGFGKVDSLNASVSTAVVVFEAVRQRINKE